MAAVDCAFFLEGDNELLINRRNLRHNSRNGACQLHNGLAITFRGRRQVRDGVLRVLVEVTVVRVCGGVLRCSMGVARLVLNQEASISVGGGEKHSDAGGDFCCMPSACSTPNNRLQTLPC